MAGKVLIIKGADFSEVAIDRVAPTGNIVITVNASPVSGGTVTGGGRYTEGQQVQIKATANYGYIFSQWNDGNTNATRTISVGDTDQTFTATFEVDTSIWLLGIAPDTEGLLAQLDGSRVYRMTPEASANLAGRPISKVIMMVNEYAASVIGSPNGTIDNFRIGYCDAGESIYSNITWLTESISGITNKTPKSFTPVTVPNGKIVVLDFGNMGYTQGKYNVAKQSAMQNVDAVIKKDDSGKATLAGYMWVDFQ